MSSVLPPSSTPPGSAAEPTWPEDAVEVGVVVGAWGIKGGLRIKPHAADPQALFSSKRWFLRFPQPLRDAQQRELVARIPVPLRIIQAREQGDAVVATAHELDDRTLAEACRGARVFIPRSSFPSAGADEYYWVDLIGLQVVNREGQVLGTVTDLLQTGPHSVLRLQDAADPDAPERLIPFVQAYVDGVDLAGRVIRVDWQPDY